MKTTGRKPKPKSDWEKFLERTQADFQRYHTEMAKGDRVLARIDAELGTLIERSDDGKQTR